MATNPATGNGGSKKRPKRKPRKSSGEKAGQRPMLSPEEWADEQLKNAPPRSEAWARRVARIYCLDLEFKPENDKRAA